MIIKRQIMWNLIGKIDPNIVFERLQKQFPNIEYFNPLNPIYKGTALNNISSLDGFKIDKVFSGIVTNIKESDVSNKNISLDINVEVYHMGMVYIEQKYTLDKWCDELKDFEGIIIKDRDGKSFSPAGVTFNLIINDLMCIEQIATLDDEYYDYGAMDKREVNKIIYDKYGIHINRIGESSLGSTSNSWSRSPNIVLDENETISVTDQDKKISDDLYIFKIKNKNIWLTNIEEDFNKVTFDVKKDFIKSCFLLLQQQIAATWLNEINNKSNLVLNSIDNKNEVYWKNLRRQIEMWQLGYLYYSTNFYGTVREFRDSLSNQNILNEDIYKEWDEEFEKDNKLAIDLFEQVRYGLENLATPGNTHDEQRLQKETEKGNERILLLSFLAMSIPMIGAIFTPTLSINLKLISGSVILFLPIIYILTRQLTFKRTDSLNTKRYLKSEGEKIQEILDKADGVRKQIKEEKTIPEDIKAAFFAFLDKSHKSQAKKLDKIDKKIESL